MRPERLLSGLEQLAIFPEDPGLVLILYITTHNYHQLQFLNELGHAFYNIIDDEPRGS